MHLLRSLERAYLAPAPAERLAALRLLVGAFAWIYLVTRLPHLASFGHLDPAGFRPIGVVDLLTDAPLSDPLALALVLAAALLGAAFVAGWRFVVSGPLFALLLLWVTTYRNSWGMVFHTENLMVVHVLVLGFTRSADAWSLDARRRPAAAPAPHTRYGWPLRLAAALTALAYLLAGIAKLRHSGLDWITSDILRNYVAWDNLRKAELGDNYSLLGFAYAPFFELERLPLFRRLRRAQGSA